MNRRAVALGLLASTITLISCSGGATPTQPDPTSTVASVSLSAPSTTLIAQQTVQLAVVLKGVDGATLTGRAVTYSSSALQTASVSASGLVTALAVGTTTITATSEGKSGTIDFTVASGTVVGPSGGTVTGGNGAVVLTIPPGALATNTPISIVPVVGTPAAAPTGVQFNGTAYQIGTAALTFAQPVTITLTYDAATLPRWVMSGDMVILGSGTTGWTSLSGIVVDTAAKTVSGTTTSIGGANGGLRASLNGATSAPLPSSMWERAAFATSALSAATPPTVTIAVNPATVTLTPGSDSVNPQKRSAMFHASIVPVGNPVTIPVPGVTSPRPIWRYRWRTTGQNGTLAGGTTDTGWLDAPDIQYICTNANLNILTGKMDDVILDVLLNPGTENDPANQQIVRVQGAVFAGLSKTFEITPDARTIGPGASQQLQFIVRDRTGSILPTDPNTRFTWNNSANAGDLQNGSRPDIVTYQARSTFTSPPPRVDRVDGQIDGVATVVERSTRWDFSNLLQPKLVVDRTQTVTYTLQGTAHTFVTVHVDYTVSLQPGTPNIAAGGTQTLTATLTPAYNGPGLAYVWSSPGTHGTLSETNGNHSANKQATYTAKSPDAGGTDQISVKVVSYLAGTELETLGIGTASIVVTAPKLAWRLTSITKVAEFGPAIVDPNNSYNIRQHFTDSLNNYYAVEDNLYYNQWITMTPVLANPALGVIYFWSGKAPGPGASIGLQVTAAGVAPDLTRAPGGPVTAPMPLGYSCTPFDPPYVCDWNGASITGDDGSGTISGTYYINTTIAATKSGVTLSGTLRIGDGRGNIIGSFPPLHYIDYTFTATRVP